MRTAAWIGVAAAGIAAAAAAWFLSTHERRDVPRTWTSPALSRDPWLPLRRFLSSRGMPVGPEASLPGIIGKARPGDALVLPDLEGDVPSRDVSSLRRWVRSGGTLLVEIDARSAVPLRCWIRREIGVLAAGDDTDAYVCPQDTEPLRNVERPVADEEDSTAPQGPRTPEGFVRTPSGTALDAGLPGTGSLRRVARRPGLFLDPGHHLGWSRSGGGIVVVAPVSTLWRARRLGERDRAELVVRLLEADHRPERIWIAREGRMRPWWMDLAGSAWPAAGVLALALALGAWAAAARTGPILELPPTAEEGVAEHVRAAGRWLWSAPGGPQRLCEALAEEARRRAERIRPGLLGAGLPEAARILSIAEGIEESQLRRTLAGEEPASVADFIERARITWRLGRSR